MNKFFYVAVLSATVATSAFAKSDRSDEVADPVKYHYGMNLDVERVISVTDTSDKAGVVPVTMVYEDSQGNVKSIEFSQVGRLGSGG
ncbi:DUF2790 domain-containing protein [Stutzerimonas marianensis]|uniref:DUF2790 domain-containing protein n=1 Tax=Stutzerimonas marianensis TaxID=2929513 RepID=UPI003C2CB0BC